MAVVDPQRPDDTSGLTQLCGTGIAFKGILEAQHEFTWPAFAPLIYNLAIIVENAWTQAA